MKRLLIAVAFIAAVATQAPATGTPTTYKGHTVIVQNVNLEAVKQRVRERVRERLRDWWDEKLAALTAPEPQPTSEPSTSAPNYSSPSSGPTHISEAVAADAMRSAGFPESVIPYFINTIIPRESGFCPTAVYPGHCGDVSLMVPGGAACSLFQLFTCPGPQAADPYVAARYAYSKYAASGLSPWGG